jgi:sporulation protein YlmC with PRC-barrel domain
MHMLSIPLSALILVLEMLSAHAKPCQGKELLDQRAKLPSFIIIPAGSTPADTLAKALNCSLPAPPTFAGGAPVKPNEVAGNQVFTEDGKHIGSVAGVTVDPNTWKMTSVVMTSDSTGTPNAAVPFDALTINKQTAALVTEGSNEKDLGKKWPLEPQVAILGSDYLFTFGWCVMCAFPSMVPIDITSDPSGGTIFIEEQVRGNTNLKGLIDTNKEQTIRIEYPKLKSCQFTDGTFTPPHAAGEYAKFFCKLAQ